MGRSHDRLRTRDARSFTLPAIVASTVVAGAGAVLIYAGTVRYTPHLTRNFLIAAGVVFVGMLLPVLLVAPTLGVGTVGQLWFVGFHLAVSVPLVVGITRTRPFGDGSMNDVRRS